MSVRRLLIAALAMAAFSLIWNGFVHLVVLREAEQALVALTRPAADRNMVLALLLTALLAGMFAWSFVATGRRNSLRSGLGHGLFFALLAGLLVDLNQYFLYPIPATLALAWFGFGVVEFCVWGLIATKLLGRTDDGQSSAA